MCTCKCKFKYIYIYIYIYIYVCVCVCVCIVHKLHYFHIHVHVKQNLTTELTVGISLYILSLYSIEARKGSPLFYFTTKRLHEQYMVSSRKNRWLYCPLAPAGSIKFSVLPAGMNMCFFHELLHQCSKKSKMIRKISWIQIFKLKYVVITSTHTFG